MHVTDTSKLSTTPEAAARRIMAGNYKEIFVGSTAPGLWCMGFDREGAPEGVQTINDIEAFIKFWIGLWTKIGFVPGCEQEIVVEHFVSQSQRKVTTGCQVCQEIG